MLKAILRIRKKSYKCVRLRMNFKNFYEILKMLKNSYEFLEFLRNSKKTCEIYTEFNVNLRKIE